MQGKSLCAPIISSGDMRSRPHLRLTGCDVYPLPAASMHFASFIASSEAAVLISLILFIPPLFLFHPIMVSYGWKQRSAKPEVVVPPFWLLVSLPILPAHYC